MLRLIGGMQMFVSRTRRTSPLTIQEKEGITPIFAGLGVMRDLQTDRGRPHTHRLQRPGVEPLLGAAPARWRWIVINCTLFLVLSGADWCRGAALSSKAAPRHNYTLFLVPCLQKPLLGTSRLLMRRFRNWRLKCCKGWKTLFSILTLGAPKEELEGGSVAFYRDSSSQKVGNYSIAFKDDLLLISEDQLVVAFFRAPHAICDWKSRQKDRCGMHERCRRHILDRHSGVTCRHPVLQEHHRPLLSHARANITCTTRRAPSRDYSHGRRVITELLFRHHTVRATMGHPRCGCGKMKICSNTRALHAHKYDGVHYSEFIEAASEVQHCINEELAAEMAVLALPAAAATAA